MKKHYNNTKKVLCAAAMLCSVHSVWAQQDNTSDSDPLKREMTLEREYDPSVQDANKVNTLPSVKEPVVTRRAIDYSDFTVPTDPEKQISTLPSGNIMAGVDYDNRRGYLDIAAGMNRNINGDFGYHILSNEKDRLNLFLSHSSNNWEPGYSSQTDEVKSKLNDNLGVINYQHSFDKAILGIRARYRYSGFNYYGITENIYNEINGISATPSSAVPDRETNQVNQTIAAGIGVRSNEDAPFGYLFDFGYTNFGSKYGIGSPAKGPTENTFDFSFDIFQPLWSGQTLGLAGKFKYLAYSVPSDGRLSTNGTDGPYYSYDFSNRAEGTVNPYYEKEGERWKLRLGAKFMFASGDDWVLMGSPDIALDAEVAYRTVFYINAGGDLHSNSMQEMSDVCRYLNPTQGIQPSRNWLDGAIGIKSGAASGFWFDVFAGYKITSDDVFLLPGTSYYDGHFANLVMAGQDINSKVLYAGANLKYNYREWFEIAVKGVYNNWDVKYQEGAILGGGSLDIENAWGKPDFVLSADLTVRPTSQLTIAANYRLETGRYMRAFSTEDIKMNNINELNLRASYVLNKTFGLSVAVNNVLNRDYDIFYGYPAQGIAILGGININF